MFSLVKQRASKHPFKSTVNSDNAKQSKKSLKPQCANLCLHILFQRKIQDELYFYNMCVFTDIFQCHIYESVSFQTASLLACCNLTSPPAWTHADKLILALSGTISIFSKDDIITVPISQLLLWDVFHTLVVPS